MDYRMKREYLKNNFWSDNAEDEKYLTEYLTRGIFHNCFYSFLFPPILIKTHFYLPYLNTSIQDNGTLNSLANFFRALNSFSASTS